MPRKLTSSAAAKVARIVPPVRIATAALVLVLALVATSGGYALADTYLQQLGGSGGGKFVGRCPKDQNLAGFDLQTGEIVDSIRPLCLVTFGPTDVGPINALPDAFGGSGGGNRKRLVCPKNAPIVVGWDVGWSGKHTVTVEAIVLLCGATGQQTTTGIPGPGFNGNSPGGFDNFGEKKQRCPAGLVAVGIAGRSGEWVDAIGLICDEPAITIKKLGIGAGEQVREVPNKGKRKPGDFAVKEVEPVPGKVKNGPGDYVLKEVADLAVIGLSGPNTLQAGLSGTYTVTVRNQGNASAPVELHIIFAKALDQTGQIVPSAGLACAIGHDAGINTGLNCTGGVLAAGGTATVVVQGRGQSAGGGVLLATLNPGHAVQESNYDNNNKQLNVTIN